MIPPAPNLPCSGQPTPEMLSGLNVRIEADEDFSVRNVQRPQLLADSSANGVGKPSTDQLAEVYVLVEAFEDLTVHPRGVANSPSP